MILNGRRNLNLIRFRLFIKSLQDEISVTSKKIREFGWVMLIILSFIVPIFISWRNDWEITNLMMIFIGAGLVLFIPSVIYPMSMKGVYRGWMLFALLLGFVMTKVLLTIIFFLLITPIGLIRQIFVKDPLKLKANPNATTYWVKRERTNNPESYEKQY